MILVDTSVLIDFFKGANNEPCRKFTEVLETPISFGITSQILQEVLQGARSITEYRKLRRYLESQRFFHPKDPVTTYAQAAKVYFDCRKKDSLSEVQSTALLLKSPWKTIYPYYIVTVTLTLWQELSR